MSTNHQIETGSDSPTSTGQITEIGEIEFEAEVDEMDLLTEQFVELNNRQSIGADVEEEQKDVFKSLVGATYENIYALTIGRLRGDKEGAADVVQETYLRAWKHRAKFRGDSKFSTWVHRIAVNTAHTYLSKRGKGTDASLDDERMDKHLEDPASIEPYEGVETKLSVPVQRMLDKLSARNRDAIILTVIMDMSDKQAGELLGVEEGAVKLRRWRTLRQLKDMALAEGVI